LSLNKPNIIEIPSKEVIQYSKETQTLVVDDDDDTLTKNQKLLIKKLPLECYG
jgi:hypothetical protein